MNLHVVNHNSNYILQKKKNMYVWDGTNSNQAQAINTYKWSLPTAGGLLAETPTDNRSSEAG